MTDSLAEDLDRTGTDPAVLPQAMQYFVAADSDYLPAEHMRDQLVAGGVDEAAIDRATALLQQDAAALERVAGFVLGSAYAGPASRENVQRALGGAREKLPVVEAAVIAIVAVYGMWLTATKGRRTHRRELQHTPDGGWKEVEVTEWYGPSEPLAAIARAVGLGGGPVGGGESNPSLPPGTAGSEGAPESPGPPPGQLGQ
jgi:hypothetical protein